VLRVDGDRGTGNGGDRRHAATCVVRSRTMR
jgi:hypothetical protein